jgi:hypothetical protein
MIEKSSMNQNFFEGVVMGIVYTTITLRNPLKDGEAIHLSGLGLERLKHLFALG